MILYAMSLIRLNYRPRLLHGLCFGIGSGWGRGVRPK